MTRSGRYRSFLFLASYIIILVSSTVRADVISDTLEGQEYIFKRDYAAALEKFIDIQKKYPASASGYFGELAIWQVMMFENLDFRFKAEYEDAQKRFDDAVFELMKGNPSSWELFMAGSGYGMRGFFYAREGKWFRALGSATRAIQLLKRAKFKEKDFVDADLGIGMYDYWRSVLTRGLHFLPFFGDRRQQGIAMVKNVIDNGKYAVKLAEANMAFIYARERKFDRSREILDRYLRDYPNNIILRQLSGDIYIDDRKYDKAAAEYKKILEIDPLMTKSLYRLGRISMKAGRKDEAVRYFKDFLATHPEKEWSKATEAQLKQLQSRVQ